MVYNILMKDAEMDNENEWLRYTVYTNLFGTLQKIWCDLLFETDTIIFPNRKFRTKLIVSSIQHSISVVIDKMKLIADKEFVSKDLILADEAMKEIRDIQGLIDKIPIESEKPIVQKYFDKLLFLIKRIILALENGDATAIK